MRNKKLVKYILTKTIPTLIIQFIGLGFLSVFVFPIFVFPMAGLGVLLFGEAGAVMFLYGLWALSVVGAVWCISLAIRDIKRQFPV